MRRPFETRVVGVDGWTLVHPCCCGNTTFAVHRLYDFGDCSVVRCQTCGQLRTFPEPVAGSEPEIFYGGAEKYSVSQTKDVGRTEIWACFSSGILRDIERLAPARGRLLEIGCNTGDLLIAARDRGWDSEGLEVNISAARNVASMGFVVYGCKVEELVVERLYQCIVVNQVLEHVALPHQFLEAIKRLLTPDGVLFIGVPCFASPIPILLKRAEWYALVPEEHVWQFGSRSLERLLRQHGFSTVWRNRGCSGFWGEFSCKPRNLARWILYRTVALVRQGDFINVIVQPSKSTGG